MDPHVLEQGPMSEEEEEEVYDTSATNSTISMSAFEAVGTSCTGTLTKKQKEKMMKKEKENKGQKKPQIDHISKADYEAKQPQFRRWLMEEKCLVADKLVEAAKKELFKKFVKKWNSRKLANKYYTANTDCWPENAPTPTTLRKWTLPPTPSTPATPAPYPPPRTTYSSSTPTPSQSTEMELGAGAFSTFGKRAGRRFMKNNEAGGVSGAGAYGTVGRKRDAITEDVAAVWDGAWRAASLQQLPTTERDSSLQDMRTSGVSGSVQSFLPPHSRRNNGPPPPRPPPPPRRTSQRSSESSEQLSGQASERWGIPEEMGSESGLEVVSLSPEDIYKVSTISHRRSGVWTVSPSIQKASPLSKVIAGSCQSLVNPAFSMSKSLEDVTVGSENALNQTPAGEGSRKMPRFKTPKSFKSLQGCSFIRTPKVSTQNKGEKGIKIASIKAPKISKKAEALKENFVIGNKRSAAEDCGTDVPDSLKGLFTAPASAKKAKLGDVTEERTGIISPIPQEDVVEGYVPEVQNLQNIKEDKKEAKKRQKELKKQEKLEKKQKEKEAKRLRMMEKLKAKEEKKQKEKRRFSTQSLNRFSRMSLREKKSESASSIPAPPPPSIPPPPPPPSIPPPPPPPPPPPLPGFGKGQGQGQRSQKVGETVIPPAKRPEVPPSPTPVRKHLGHRSVSGSVDENIMQELARKMPPPPDVTSTPLMTRRAPSSRSLSSSSVRGQASLRKIPPTPPLKTRSGGESTEVTGSGVTEQRSRRRQIPSKKMPRDQTRSRSRARARARSRSRSQARGEEISLESMGAVCDTPPPPPLPHNPSKSSLHVPVADFVPPSPSNLPLPPPPSDLPLPPPPSISPSPSLNTLANKPPHTKPAIKSKPLAMKKVAPKKPPRKSLTPKTARARSVTGLTGGIPMNFDDMK